MLICGVIGRIVKNNTKGFDMQDKIEDKNTILIYKHNFDKVPPHLIERLYDTLSKLNYYIPDDIQIKNTKYIFMTLEERNRK